MTPPRTTRAAPRALRTAQASWFALLVLAVAWEAWLAPLRPGGSWLVLKALPLLVLAPRVLRAEPKGLQWGVLLVPFYLAEAVLRIPEPLPYRACAALELVFGATFFVAAVLALRPYKRKEGSR